ncbi:fimbrial protein [Providencia manganoxydans]|uniref:fimbrial protein n=1 Tax=Providencia manganoxydans TaxID=2923283 RepID=UPI003AF3D7AB
MFKKIIILLFFTKTFSALASSDTLEKYSPSDKVWWQGTAKFLGKVISPACTLDMDSKYQLIDLGVIPVNKFDDDSLLLNKKIKIKLSDCQFITKSRNIDKVKGITLTFYSDTNGSDPSLFSFNDNKDIYFKIINELGYTARSGEPLPIVYIDGDSTYLYYQLDIMKKSEIVKPGSYYASVLFKINYE